MLTVRISPKIKREAGRDDEHQAGEGEPVEQRDDELARLGDGRPGGRPGREEQHPADDEHDRHAHRNRG